MPVTVGDFYEDLRVVLARGNTTDARMKVWSRVALRFLERGFTFDYMKNGYFLMLEPGAASFNLATATPPVPLKEIEAIGYYGADGGMLQFKRRNVFSMGAMNGTVHTTYRTMGTNIIFEGLLDPAGLSEETVSYPIEMHTGNFTEWPEDVDATHPILEIADDLMKYQVLLSSTPSLRKQSEASGWKFMRDEAMAGLRVLEDSKEMEDDVRMEYRGGPDGRLFSSASEAISHICGMYDIPQTYHVFGLYHVFCGGGMAGAPPVDGGGGGGGGPIIPLPPDSGLTSDLLHEFGLRMMLEDGTGVILLEVQ